MGKGNTVDEFFKRLDDLGRGEHQKIVREVMNRIDSVAKKSINYVLSKDDIAKLLRRSVEEVASTNKIKIKVAWGDECQRSEIEKFMKKFPSCVKLFGYQPYGYEVFVLFVPEDLLEAEESSGLTMHYWIWP
jgi:hypothetical protein